MRTDERQKSGRVGQASRIRSIDAPPVWEEPLSTTQNTRRADAYALDTRRNLTDVQRSHPRRKHKRPPFGRRFVASRAQLSASDARVLGGSLRRSPRGVPKRQSGLRRRCSPKRGCRRSVRRILEAH